MNATSLRQPAVWIPALALLAVAGASVWGLGPVARAARPAAAAGPVVATTVPVRQQDMPNYRAGVGTVTAAASVTVRARIDGQLESVGFVEGQDVKAGQVLARIDPRTLQAQLEQAQAQKARDQATLANAHTDLKRYTALIAEDAATPQQFDTQKALVAQLEAAVQTDDAQIHFAQVQLGFTTIAAPMAGRVGARLVDPGNIVHAADAGGLVVINQIDPIAVVFTLPDGTVPDINHALAASRTPLVVQAFARDGLQPLGSGHLVLLNNQIDTASGTVQLKASFPNPQHVLWPGQFVNVRLVLGTRAQALTVPAAAVQRGPAGTYVYGVGTDGKAQLRPVEVAQIQDGTAVIGGGLKAGETVVVDGQYKLSPGVSVSARAPASAPASAPPGGVRP